MSNITIDFQARLIHSRSWQSATRNTVTYALEWLLPVPELYDWGWATRFDNDQVQTLVLNKTNGDTHRFNFDLQRRLINAALLEQLHNEVTAWFTKIKNEVQA